MRALIASVVLSLAPLQVSACDLALALAVDISGSVDPKEYDIQMQGLSAALRDGVVAEALVRAEDETTLEPLLFVDLNETADANEPGVCVTYALLIPDIADEDEKPVESGVEHDPDRWRT